MRAIGLGGLRRLYEAAVTDEKNGRGPKLATFYEEIKNGLDSKQIDPNRISLSELFDNFVFDSKGDLCGRELRESWNPKHGGGVQLLEAGNAVDTSVFSNITGQIVYSTIMQVMASEVFAFSQLVTTVPTQLSGEKIPGVGQLGDKAEVVGEAQQYPTVGVGEDYIETPATTKRGLIVPVTKEAIFFDRTGLVLGRCRDVGEALAVGKEKRIIDAYVDENSTAHRYKWKGTSYATFQASTPWINIKSSNTLVDWTDIDAAEQILNAITDPNTGEPVMSEPTHLICCKELEQTARRIVNASEITVVTAGYATSGNPTETKAGNPYRNKYQVLSSRLLAARMATDTSWFLTNPAKQVAYMENWPMTIAQAPVNSEAEFTQDIVLRFKASERGAAAVMEPRVAVKSTVA